MIVAAFGNKMPVDESFKSVLKEFAWILFAADGFELTLKAIKTFKK